MKLVKRLTPPIMVREFLIETDKTSQWYGYLFVKGKDGEILHAADLKPHLDDIRKARP